MNNGKDELEIFDHLEDEQEAPQQFRRINEAPAPSGEPRNGKRLIITVILLLLLALGVWRFIQWNNSTSQTPEQITAPVTTSPSSEANIPSTSASYLNGDKPQAVEGRPAANPSAVTIAPASKPEVDTKDAESVMRGFITITNSRDSAEPNDFERVKEWAAPYSAIEDMGGFDAYGNDTADVLPAPVTVEKIEVKDPTGDQPRDTSIRRSRVLETTVLASTGQKLRLEWEVTTMMDEGENWKVTDAQLKNWQGISE